MATPSIFVLVHGAFHGGWCWRHVAERLRREGHLVHTPTLTGQGERAHLLRPGIDLRDHVEDVVQLLECEEIHDIVLVGHSYGGAVITGVVDRAFDRVRAAVFLDAFLPEEGQRVVDISPTAYEGDPVPPPEPSVYVSDPSQVEWVRRRLTPQPRATLTSPAFGESSVTRLERKMYVRAAFFNHPVTTDAAARVGGDPRWKVETLHGGHDLMVDCPEDVARLLVDIATDESTSLREPR